MDRSWARVRMATNLWDSIGPNMGLSRRFLCRCLETAEVTRMPSTRMVSFAVVPKPIWVLGPYSGGSSKQALLARLNCPRRNMQYAVAINDNRRR